MDEFTYEGVHVDQIARCDDLASVAYIGVYIQG